MEMNKSFELYEVTAVEPPPKTKVKCEVQLSLQ